MDFESRDTYRRTIAHLAKHSEATEQEVARKALELAGVLHCSPNQRVKERESHVGYYLVGDGRKTLEQAIGYRATLAERMQRLAKRWPDFSYILGIELLALAVLGDGGDRRPREILGSDGGGAVPAAGRGMRGGADESAGHHAISAEADAEAGLFQGRAGRVHDDGGGADTADQRSAGGARRPGSGSAIPCQPRPQSSFRVADRSTRLGATVRRQGQAGYGLRAHD